MRNLLFTLGCVLCQTAAGPAIYRWAATPTWRHMSSTGQIEHRGSRPVHTCLPNGTSSALISTQYRRGSFLMSAAIVRSGVGSRDVPPPVGHAVHVDVHADQALPARYAEREMRALGADATEAAKQLGVARQRAGEVRRGPARDLEDLGRLRRMEAGVADEPVERRDVERRDPLRPWRRREQPACRHQAHFVAGPDAQDAGDELLEQGAVPFLGEREHRRFGQRAHGPPNAAERQADSEGPLQRQPVEPATRRSTPPYPEEGYARRS